MSLFEQLSRFRCLRLRVEVAATRRIELPAYLGSTLRGAFGMALRRSACALRRQECRTCLLRTSCIYSYTFETPAPEGPEQHRRYATAPHPFVLNLETGSSGIQEAGTIFSFGITLVGRACDFLPYFVYAFQRMGEVGIGKGRGTFELLQVHNLGLADEARLSGAACDQSMIPRLAPPHPGIPPLSKDHDVISPLPKDHTLIPPLSKDHNVNPPLSKGGRGDFIPGGDDGDPISPDIYSAETLYQDGVLTMPREFLGLREAQNLSAQLSRQAVRLRFLTPLRLVVDGDCALIRSSISWRGTCCGGLATWFPFIAARRLTFLSAPSSMLRKRCALPSAGPAGTTGNDTRNGRTNA